MPPPPADDDPPSPVDPLQITVPGRSILNFLPLPGAAKTYLRFEEDWVDLSEIGGPRLEPEDITGVEFDRDPADPGVYRVRLATGPGPVPVLRMGDRVVARAFAERLAKRLRRTLKDLTGEMLRLRTPDQLDRPLCLQAPDAGPLDPRWGLACTEAPGDLCIAWAQPALGAAAGLGLAAIVVVGFGQTTLAVGLGLAALGCLLLRSRLRVAAGGIAGSRGLGPLGLTTRIPARELEQVEVESGEPDRLVLVADHGVISVLRPRAQLLWIRARLLQELRVQAGGPED